MISSSADIQNRNKRVILFSNVNGSMLSLHESNTCLTLAEICSIFVRSEPSFRRIDHSTSSPHSFRRIPRTGAVHNHRHSGESRNPEGKGNEEAPQFRALNCPGSSCAQNPHARTQRKIDTRHSRPTAYPSHHSKSSPSQFNTCVPHTSVP